jgi:hypothetical protein
VPIVYIWAWQAPLAKLKAIMKEGTVTAGNAAQQNDAAGSRSIIRPYRGA